MNRIDNIADLLVYLGGQSAVADWLNIRQPSVAEWITRNAIPGRHRIKIVARLLAEGADFDPALLGMTGDELAVMRAHPSKKSKYVNQLVA